MAAEERAAAEAMYRALALMPCACGHNVPYSGCKIEQKVTHRCVRCKAMLAWEMVMLEEA
jgi:hypothetical protein